MVITNWPKRACWVVVNLCRWLLAITFILSGTVKLIDPLGTQYKIEEYALAWGVPGPMPAVAPLVLAVILALVEFDLGVCIFFGLHRKRASRFALVFILVMLLLTLHAAVTGAVAHCGCFGDAWPLTPWQTVTKNLLLASAAVVVVWRHRQITRFVLEHNQWMVTLYTKAFAFVFVCISLYGLPVMDFRPYHIGADLLQKMGLKTDEANGEGLPEITDFAMMPTDGSADIATSFLEQDTYKFLLLAPQLDTADEGVMDGIATVHDYARSHGYPFYCLTASPDSAIRRWTEVTGAEYPFCRTDGTELKTMIRSNPGLMLLHGSVVKAKWPSTNFPTATQLTAPIEQLPTLVPGSDHQWAGLLRIVLWYVLPMLAITLADRVWLGVKQRKLYNKQHKSLIRFNNKN